MKSVLMTISLLGLLLTIVPSILVFVNILPMQDNFNLMIVGTIFWFGSAPFWMKSKKMDM